MPQAGGTPGDKGDRLKAPQLIGPKLSTEEVNRARDRAPVDKSGVLLCWSNLTHVGCLVANCQRSHEPLRGQFEQLDPAVRMQLIRRGGLRRMKQETPQTAEVKIKELRQQVTQDKSDKIAKPKRKAGEANEENVEEPSSRAGGEQRVKFNEIPEEFEAVDYTKQEDVQELLKAPDGFWGVPQQHQDRPHGAGEGKAPEKAKELVTRARRLSEGPVLKALEGASDDLYAWAASRVSREEGIRTEDLLEEMVLFGASDLAQEASELLEGVNPSSKAGERARLVVKETLWAPGEPGQGGLEVDGVAWRTWDYQEEVMMTEELAAVLKLVEPVEERRQCVTKTIAAGVLWRRLGRRPTMDEVAQEAAALRLEQARQALEGSDQMGEALEFVTPVEHELRCQAHDVLHPHHERDFRTLAVFPVQALEDAKVVVLRADVRGRLLIEEVVGPNWQPQGWTIYALIWKGHMVLAQPPENFHAVSWLDGEEVQTTPVLGFGFYWHGRHDQPLSAPGRIACRLCRPSRKAGDRVTNHPRHSQLPVVAISAGSATQNEVKRRVRGGEHGQLVLRELFAGKATLTEQWRRQGGKALEPVEVFRDPHTREGYQSEHDLMKPEIRARHLARAKEGPENIGWVAAPCTSYCDWNLENGGSRTFTQPQGGSGRALTEREQEGNVLSTFAANYFEAMLDAGGFPMAESSGCSGRYPKQWDLPCWRRILRRPDVDFVEFRMCSFGLGPPDEPGAFYQHLTRVVFPRHDAVRAVLSRRCPGVSANHRHVALKGARPGVQITRCTEAGVYCPEFVQTVCQVLRDSLFVGGVGPTWCTKDKESKRAGGESLDEEDGDEATAGEDENEAEVAGTEDGDAEDAVAEDAGAEDGGTEDAGAEDGGTEDAESGADGAKGAGDAQKDDECDAIREEKQSEEGEEFHAPEEGDEAELRTPHWRPHAEAASGSGGPDSGAGGGGRSIVDLFGQPGTWEDGRGGPLDQWVRSIREGEQELSPDHREMTHEGVWADEPLPASQQGPGQPGEVDENVDYMQTYAAGYVVIHHCRKRQEYFYPGGIGFPVDPSRLRNERMSVCTFTTGVLSFAPAMTIEDNWRLAGPHRQAGGGAWWTGFTVLVLQGRGLPWESPPPSEEHVEGDDEETTDDDPELSDVGSLSTWATEATHGASRSRSRSARRAAGAGGGQEPVDRLAEAYMNVLGEVEDPTPKAWAKVLKAGDELLRATGDVRVAAEALWKKRDEMGFNNLRGVREKVLDEVLHPNVVEYLRSVEEKGMVARYDGERRRIASGLHPNAKKHLGQVYKQIWKDVRKKRVLVVRKANEALRDTISSPFEAVDKMMPDRTIAPDKRVIHDQRQVNLGSDKLWHPPALQPTHQQVARRVLWCQARYPNIPVLIAKKDIAGAFRLLWVAPEDVPLFAGDLPWREEHMAEDEREEEQEGPDQGSEMTVLYLVSSFGFLGSPGEWTVWGRATEEFHRAHRPGFPRRDGAAGFDCKILVDDAILIEPELGLRPWISADCYETGVRLMLGKEAVNEEKDALEGSFKSEQTIWGLTMNTETNQVALPERRILKGAHLLDAGNKGLCLRQLQQFRGIATGWAVVVKGLKNELKAADIFLTSGDGALPVRPRERGYRDEQKARKDAWEDLWELFEVCRWLCARSETWGRSFGSTLEELLDAKERLALPQGPQHAVFVSADATKRVIGAIDWTYGKASRMRQEEIGPWLASVVEGEADEEGIRIHVTEMLAIVSFASRRCEEWAGKVVIYAGDNKVVRQWIDRRQSGSRAGRLLLRALAMCEMKYGFEIIAGWWRTFHNVDSDFITRCSEDQYREYLEKKGWEDVDVTAAIEEAVQDSRRFGQCFLSWADPEDRRISMQLKERRLKRAVERPIGPPWAEFMVKEWTGGEREVKDFELVAQSCGATNPEACWVLCAATVGCDVDGKNLAKFVKWAEEAQATVAVVEGPHLAGWDRLREASVASGWFPQFIDYITTECGEALARRRKAALLTRVPIDAELVEAGLVRAAVATPIGALLEDRKKDEELVWRYPMRLELAAGAPRDPLLPHIAAHYWESPEVRKNAHGFTGPGKWPLRSKEGPEYEELIFYDRCGPPGALRCLSYEEVWQCQGRTIEEWNETLRRTGWSKRRVYEDGCKATGVQTAQTLLTLAGLMAEVVGDETSGGRAGAVRDGAQDESLARLLWWLRKWKQGEFGREGRLAGGSVTELVWCWGETLWCDALDDLQRMEYEDEIRAGGRRKKEDAAVKIGQANVVGHLDPQPFDGDVKGRIDDWLEANMTGDKAESTTRAYASMWQRWSAWAQRQQWYTPYLNPNDPKLTNENKMLGFLGYLGWLGSSAASMKQALFAIKDAHKRAGYGDPTSDAFRVWVLINALDRRAARKPRRLGVTPGMLRWIGGQLETEENTRGETKVNAAMLNAALLTAWFFMMRASEYCESGPLNKEMILRGVDVKLTKEGEDAGEGEANEVTVQFRKTKSDQEAFGSCKTMGSTGTPYLCPVQALERYRKVAPSRFRGGDAWAPLFRWADGSMLKRLEVQEILQRAARAEGLPADRFLSHSLRIGGASALFQVSADVELVKRMGRWSSAAVQRYLHDGGHVLKQLASKMANVDQRIHYT